MNPANKIKSVLYNFKTFSYSICSVSGNLFLLIILNWIELSAANLIAPELGLLDIKSFITPFILPVLISL